jgi:hypothetical protein
VQKTNNVKNKIKACFLFLNLPSINTITPVSPTLKPILFVINTARSLDIPIRSRTGLKIRLNARINTKNANAPL